MRSDQRWQVNLLPTCVIILQTPLAVCPFNRVRFFYRLLLILGIVQLFFEGSNMLSNIFVITKNILDKYNEIF